MMLVYFYFSPSNSLTISLQRLLCTTNQAEKYHCHATFLFALYQLGILQYTVFQFLFQGYSFFTKVYGSLYAHFLTLLAPGMTS